jgi:hypothetical protein
VSQRQKQRTNENRARRLGTGEGIARNKRQTRSAGTPRWVWIVVGVLVIAVLALGGALILRGHNGSSSSGSFWPNAPIPAVVQQRNSTQKLDFISTTTWPVNLNNIQQAASALGLPNQSDSIEHYHAHFDIWVDGHKVEVPPNMGLTPTWFSPLHTHTYSNVPDNLSRGVIHIEADHKGYVALLGQVFDMWGVRLDNNCMGGNCGGVKIWVNGKPSTAGPELKLHPHNEVAVVVGTPPKNFTPPKSFQFAPGE